MRACGVAAGLLLAWTASATAEQMIGAPPKRDGLMCRSEKALAELTAPDGGVDFDMDKPDSPAGRHYAASCQHVMGGEEVTVVTRRRNTSIVTFQGQTWYVPNIDFMIPGPGCLKPGAKVTVTGTIEQGFKRTDEVDPRKGYRYPRLALDRPVCFLGNAARNQDRTVSLLGDSEKASVDIAGMVGRHVTISGVLDTPDNGNQPPDNMMMFAPAIRPAP